MTFPYALRRDFVLNYITWTGLHRSLVFPYALRRDFVLNC